ncbi:MAG: hypothetical protein Q4A17_06645 [Thermoguttaceae bacterium]|nr:hypothetical protein [Thermoguttaceae bacterium]
MKVKVFALCLALLFGTPFASAAVWQTSGSGNWSDGVNWDSTVPNAEGAVADFTSSALTAAGTVTLGSDITIGSLQTGTAAAKTWTFTGSTLTMNNGSENAAITVASGATTVINSALSSAGTVAVSGGGTLQVSNASGVQGWSVTGTILEDVVDATTGSLGSGTIYLNDGATLKSVGGKRRAYSNPIVFSGNTTLHSQGLTLNGQLSGTGTISFTGGWNMPIAKNNSETLSADWLVKQDFLQPTVNGALGTGKVTIQASGLAAGIIGGGSLTEISNPIEVRSAINFLVGNRSVITLTGPLTGTANIEMRSNQYGIASVTNLQGDGHAFSGNWNMHQNYINNGDLAAVYTVTTNNTNEEKQDGGDSRFGTGEIHMGRVIVSPFAGTNAFIHNNIFFDLDTAATNLDGKIATFNIPASSTLTLTGQLSGTFPYTVTGANRDSSVFRLTGTNSTSGNVSVSDATVEFNNASVFGTSKVTLDNVTIYQCGTSAVDLPTDIEAAGDVTIKMQGWESGKNGGLTLSGKLTGSGSIIRSGGNYELRLEGDNTGFSGDWHLNTDVVFTSNTAHYDYNGTDTRFGSGVIYVQGGGISTGNTETFIDNNIIATGQFLMRGTKQTYRGIVSLNNSTLTRNSTVPTLRFENQLMGNGSINFTTTLGSGATISPGDTLNADGTVTKGIGTITITENGTLALEDGSILNFDVASKTSYDQIVFAAATTLDLDGATVNLNFTEDFDPTDIGIGDTLTLFGTNTTLQTDGAALRYNVSQLPETAQWMRFMLVPQGVQVVSGDYIPEPSAWILLLLGTGIFGTFARSGKNKNN